MPVWIRGTVFAAIVAILGSAALGAEPTQEGRLPASLAGYVLPLDRLHQGRYQRHHYTLAVHGATLTVLFAPLPLLNSPDTIRGAAVHVLDVAFKIRTDQVRPVARDIDGVPVWTLTASGRTYVVLPVRNERGLVHSLIIWVDAPSSARP